MPNQLEGPEESPEPKISQQASGIGLPFSLKEINLAAWTLFAALLLLPFGTYIGMQIRSAPASFPRYHTDFVYLYGIGRIAREQPAASLYDLALQQKTFNELSPAPAGFYGPSPYPPLAAYFFSLFTHIPFGPAYLLWDAISFLLYLVGIGAAARAVELRNGQESSLFYCLSLASYPFFVETIINGQLSAVAVCCIGLAVLADLRTRPYASGLALSILAYKPPLLVLLLPMLLLTRRFKTLAGFASGAAIYFAASTALAGPGIWIVYLRFLRMFGRMSGVNGSSLMNLSKYVDLSAASHAIPGGRSAFGLTVLACASAAVVLSLTVLLWRSTSANRPAQWLAWAAALTWTLLLNVYVPVWDCSLATISMLLTFSALRELEWKRAMRWNLLLFVLIFAGAWITEPIALKHGFQILTLLLAVLGVGQLVLLMRAITQGVRPPQADPVAA